MKSNVRPEGSRCLIGTVNNFSETEAKVEFLCHAGGLCQEQNELIFGTSPLKAGVPLEKQDREKKELIFSISIYKQRFVYSQRVCILSISHKDSNGIGKIFAS